MPNYESWLWPDRVIGKRESRVLREEHNALVNAYAELEKKLSKTTVEDSTKVAVTKQLVAGKTDRQIAAELMTSQDYVRKVRTESIRDGKLKLESGRLVLA